MYGWIQDCIEALVLENFGAGVWAKIKQEAGITTPNGAFGRHTYYEDSVTYDRLHLLENYYYWALTHHVK